MGHSVKADNCFGTLRSAAARALAPGGRVFRFGSFSERFRPTDPETLCDMSLKALTQGGLDRRGPVKRPRTGSHRPVSISEGRYTSVRKAEGINARVLQLRRRSSQRPADTAMRSGPRWAGSGSQRKVERRDSCCDERLFSLALRSVRLFCDSESGNVRRAPGPSACSALVERPQASRPARSPRAESARGRAPRGTTRCTRACSPPPAAQGR